jgi:hypothetical protein
VFAKAYQTGKNAATVIESIAGSKLFNNIGNSKSTNHGKYTAKSTLP